MSTPTPEHCEIDCPSCRQRFDANPAPWAEHEQPNDPRTWWRAAWACPRCRQALNLYRVAMETRFGWRWQARADVTT